MPLTLPQSGLIFNNYIDYDNDKIKVTTFPEEMNEINILMLSTGGYYNIGGAPSSKATDSFKGTFNFVLTSTYTHLPPIREPQYLFLKDNQKKFPAVAFVDEGDPNNPKQIPYNLYNQNFFLLTVAARKNIQKLDEKIKDGLNVIISDLNTLTSKVLLTIQAFSGLNVLAYSNKTFTLNSKMIAAMDYIFTDPAGEFAIPMVDKIIGDKEFLVKLAAEGAKKGGVPITKLGDLATQNVSFGGFVSSEKDIPEGFAGTGFDSTGAGVTDPPEQEQPPPTPPPGFGGDGDGGSGGGY